ncbi:MAG: transporter substrate-binding domain-containing protein, partial [Anaeroplasmataceae bacterium]|nr:transporter substrate-binding domain-containing protein [Anaeroplasmataceae bacterium]
FIACLIFIFSNFATAFAADEHSDTETIKAGIFNFEGYHMQDEDGRLSGYGIEFLNLVSEYSRLNFQYIGYDKEWDDMIPMLRNGEIDVVTSASRTEEREAEFAFSLPIGRRKTILSIRVDDTTHRRGEYSTYNNMKVGLVTGSSQNDDFFRFKEAKGFTCTEIYGKADELATKLQNGEIDAILSSNLRKSENEKTLDIVEEADFYAIVRKSDIDLLNEINYAIEQMNINEGDWQNELFYKYYGPVYSSTLTFTEREKEYIRKVVMGEKTITVTALGNREPYSYTENGELKGIIPDYFAEVMKLAGLPYEIVAPKDKDDYLNLASENGVNVVLDSISSDDAIKDADCNGFKTKSYMTASIARVTRQDFKGDIKVVAVSDSQGKNLIEPFLGGYEVKNYSTGEEAMRAVLNHEVDVAYVYAYTAQLFVNHDSTKSLYYSTMNGMSTNFSMHISEATDHELITILNKCIKQMSDEILNQLASNYTSYTIGDLTFLQYLQANPGLIVAVVLMFAIIVGVILVLILRGQWNKKLLYTTELSNKKMEEQLSIVAALSRDYTNVYAINEEQRTARILKLEGYVAEGLNKDSTDEYNYTVILQNYIHSRVLPEDQEELAQALSLENIKEKLSTEDSYQGSYRILDDGDIHHFQYTYLKIA